ncbi:MAG: cobalamin biosynthesis protein CbiM [Geobacteraceae bacterium GWC2_53_11]|nr:MAG: cobalamin biosynthesis protein CbiM [Geobacteraceae bacterium GWC2_53_11]
MHMADALLSPAVGGAMWAVSAGTIAYCSAKVRAELDDSKIPLMGVLGAFIFAAQMINFTIPVTGSSGHLGGGLILAILLGPYAAFLTIASVLMVQALFFADGGLLALGCNIFNLGFFPAFIAYPLLYKKIIGAQPTATRISVAAMIAAIAGLQMGAFGVVLETIVSGVSSLPFSTFVVMMQPIHLAIGIVEGLVTASVVSFVYKARPEIMQSALNARPIGNHPVRKIVLAFLAAAVVTGGIISLLASENPDGLEWAIAKVTGHNELKEPENALHGSLKVLQEKIAILPDYSLKKPAEATKDKLQPEAVQNHPSAKPETKSETPKNPAGTTVSGLAGGAITLGLAFLIGFILKRRNQNGTS